MGALYRIYGKQREYRILQSTVHAIWFGIEPRDVYTVLRYYKGGVGYNTHTRHGHAKMEGQQYHHARGKKWWGEQGYQ